MQSLGGLAIKVLGFRVSVWEVFCKKSARAESLNG